MKRKSDGNSFYPLDSYGSLTTPRSIIIQQSLPDNNSKKHELIDQDLDFNYLSQFKGNSSHVVREQLNNLNFKKEIITFDCLFDNIVQKQV